ncbi:MAG: helix-turn-helix transcriptional regulator [Lachnospiraceae bacterium]|nr:helix-turn-helix transcriptional regulator [Lachnospiraceae bacterium]
MWKDSKAVVRNVIMYFIPFVIMAMVAVFFLHHSFVMLQEQNMSIMKEQMQNVLDDMEESLAYSMDIAKDMCIDSALRRKNMESNDANTVAGISKMLTYKARMKMCNTLFLNYQPERVITEVGISDMEVFIRNQLQLSNVGEEQFYNMLEQEESFISGVLQRKDGESYLLFLYYFPEGIHLEEQRIGFLLDVGQLNTELEQILIGINSLAVMQINDQLITSVNCLSEKVDDDTLQEMLVQLKDGEEIKGFSTIYIETQYLDLSMQMAVNSGEMKAELMREEIKMALIGVFVFLIMSVFLWSYGKYRYKMLNEIKQFAVSHHPELKGDTKESEYSVIRKVLEKDLEKLNRKDEVFSLFKSEAKKQLTWLLLNSTPPSELELESLMDTYDIPEGGPYYSVLEFILEGTEVSGDIDLSLTHPEILIQYTTCIGTGKMYIAAISLESRDDDHAERTRIIRSIRNELFSKGVYCKKVASGLVYGSLREIHSSQQESLTLIQDESLWKNGKEVLFFDERAHMTKRVPHITADLLEQFREKLLKNDVEDARSVLAALMAPPKTMAEDLIIYIRYKVISILMEAATEKGISDTQIRDMINLNNLESETFEIEVSDVIAKSFVPAKEKSVDISEILAFIEEQYTNTEISQEMMAEHLGSNVRTIRRIMKREIGQTYKEYLNAVRVKKACELLEKTDWTIQKISKEVGCYEVASFYRVFKQVMEMTPDEYRKQ